MSIFNFRSVEILLVEDNPGDVLLTTEAFAESKIRNHIRVAEDGEKAISYLYKRGDYSNAATPDLILLDLNLPRVDGREVLQRIKQDDVLRRIPVVIMTSSKAEEDIVRTYDLHANSYIIKPIDLDKFAEIVNAIENFWFCVVVLPSEEIH